MRHLKPYKIFESIWETDVNDDFFADMRDICRDIEDNGFECKIGSMFDIDQITIKIKPIVEYSGVEEGPKHGWVDFYADDIDIDVLKRLVDYTKSIFPDSVEWVNVEFLYGPPFQLKFETYKSALSTKEPNYLLCFQRKPNHLPGMCSSKLQNNPMRSLSLVIDLNI